MQAMAANASPEMIQRAQEMMRNMSPEQMQNMQKMAAGMGMVPPGGAPMAQQMSARDKYQYDAALILKNDGNALHGRSEHSEAITKYDRARNNIQGQTSKEATELRKACSLNMAMCHLKLEQFEDCARECTQVISAGV